MSMCMKTRAETMTLALHTVRAAAGSNTFLIGCGCPIGSAIGYVDGMRISADTGPSWHPSFPLPWWDNGTLPSLRAMIRNSITRSNLSHVWWHNDPDCILLGHSTNLTEMEVKSAASVVAMTGGMLLLSDDLMKLSQERLGIGSKIFPIAGAVSLPLDLHGKLSLERDDKTKQNNANKQNNRWGIPCLMKLWCSDVALGETIQSSAKIAPDNNKDNTDKHNNAMEEEIMDAQIRADLYKRYSLATSFDCHNKDQDLRNCIRMAQGMGISFIVSMSNWGDTSTVVSTPLSIILSSNNSGKYKLEWEDGYHIFSFWTCKYIWIPSHTTSTLSSCMDSNSKPMTTPAESFHDEQTLSKNLSPHETELFHIKPVSINCPQYVGSSLHFTCGMEVESFEWAMGDCNDDVLGHIGCSVLIQLKTNYNRSGDIYVYLPRYTRRHFQKNNSTGITVNGKCGEASFIAQIPFKTNELKRSKKVTENADQFLSTIEADNNNVEDNPCFGGCVVKINVAISPNEDSAIIDGDSCNIKAGEVRIEY